MDAVQVLQGVRRVLAVEALNLASTLSSEDLEYRGLRLVPIHETHPSFVQFWRFFEARVSHGLQKLGKELICILLGLLGKSVARPYTIELGQYKVRWGLFLLGKDFSIVEKQAKYTVFSVTANFLMLALT